MFPPPPFEDPEIETKQYPPAVTRRPGGPDGIWFPLLFDYKSRAFWDKWDKLLPRTPREIDFEQEHLAGIYQQTVEEAARFRSKHNVPDEVVARMLVGKAYKREEVVAKGYPPEAFTDEALEERVGMRGPCPGGKDGMKAWQVAYLERLTREGVPEMYLNAYRKAWGNKKEK